MPLVSQEDETARTELANAERELEHIQSSDPAASKALHARREDIESRVLEISEGVLAAHLILCARRQVPVGDPAASARCHSIGALSYTVRVFRHGVETRDKTPGRRCSRVQPDQAAGIRLQGSRRSAQARGLGC